ncbi:MAG: hypothetical protein QF662_01945, partial [Phycisphaerae bacterium]|nr:hypothetical protein [Phycisphaerae bacterium]
MRLFARTTLEAKCRLIFGLFILLIIAASMFWPWSQMEQLVMRANRKRAELLSKTIWGNVHAMKLAG